VSRWREIRRARSLGPVLHYRDVRSGRVWSAAHRPTLVEAERYDLSFTRVPKPDPAIDDDIETQMVVSVSTEDNAEDPRLDPHQPRHDRARD
jgi:hypothetical protein